MVSDCVLFEFICGDSFLIKKAEVERAVIDLRYEFLCAVVMK